MLAAFFAAAFALLVASLLYRGPYMRQRGRQVLRTGAAAFTHEPELARYAEAAPRVNFGDRKVPQAVLLLHGFSGCAGAFKHLTPALEAAGIPYYAPNLTGFGLDDARLLEQVRAEDWRRDAIQAYDVLAALADEVSLVGFSYGATLAAFVSARRPVKHLVLVGPYFYMQDAGHAQMASLAKKRWGPMVLKGLKPWVLKQLRPGRAGLSDLLDPAGAAGLFSYTAAPMNGAVQVFRSATPDLVGSLSAATLTILYGAAEGTSNVPTLLADLDARHMQYDVQRYAASAHNLLDDFDQAEAVARIVKALSA